MTRLLFPAMAMTLVLAGVTASAQDTPDAKAAAGAMNCNMMAGMKMGAMRDGPASDVVAKLTAKKKELKLNDKQIQQIAAALAEPHDMPGMPGMMKGQAAEPPAAGHEHQP